MPCWRNDYGATSGGSAERYLQLGRGAVHVVVRRQRVVRRVRRGPTARVPDGGALQEHLLAVAERVAALGAARARGVEVVVVAGLQHLAGDVALAVGAAYAEQPLVVALAVRRAAAAHVLALQHLPALAAREAPRVPLPAMDQPPHVTSFRPLPQVDALPAAALTCPKRPALVLPTALARNPHILETDISQ